MSLVEHQLLSKIIDDNNCQVLNKYNVTDQDFYVAHDIYQFVKNYVDEHKTAPDYRTVVAEFEHFSYFPEVVDSYSYLCKSLKNASAKRGAIELLQKRASVKFQEMQGTDFVNWLANEVSHLQEVTSAESHSGVNYATNGDERWSTYEDNKENRTFKFIPTPYESLTGFLGGGFELGDYILLQAYTNRGKSWIASHIGVKAWMSNFGVLHYSPELSEAQQMQRNDTLLGHFDNVQLKKGELNDISEKKYKGFLSEFNETNTVPYIIKTMEHLPQGLSLAVIEADIIANPDCKMVIIDGFNLLSHKGKDGNRNNMSNTSRALRQLFARHQVAGVVVHQTPTSAERENGGEDETGARMVNPAKLHQYSETIAVIQDACTVLNFDQSDGVGKILIAKTRTPHVDKEVTLHCDYNNGYIKEATYVDYI